MRYAGYHFSSFTWAAVVSSSKIQNERGKNKMLVPLALVPPPQNFEMRWGERGGAAQFAAGTGNRGIKMYLGLSLRELAGRAARP